VDDASNGRNSRPPCRPAPDFDAARRLRAEPGPHGWAVREGRLFTSCRGAQVPGVRRVSGAGRRGPAKVDTHADGTGRGTRCTWGRDEHRATAEEAGRPASAGSLRITFAPRACWAAPGEALAASGDDWLRGETAKDIGCPQDRIEARHAGPMVTLADDLAVEAGDVRSGLVGRGRVRS